MGKALVHKFGDGKAVGAALVRYVAEQSSKAIKERGKFNIALSGGSLPLLLAGLTEEPFVSSVDWSRWRVFFADERHVPLDHPDSNYKANNDAFISKTPLHKTQIYAINAHVPVEESAKEYEREMIFAFDNAPVKFDLILLGMGPDGHTCSLFPGHHLTAEKSSRLVASISDSPKPPPTRITFLYSVLNSARAVAFGATGDAKKDLLKVILEPSPSEIDQSNTLPAKLVNPGDGELRWFVDDAAAVKLTSFDAFSTSAAL